MSLLVSLDEWMMGRADSLAQWAWDRFELHLRTIMRAVFLAWLVTDYSGRRLQNDVDMEFWVAWLVTTAYAAVVEWTFHWPAKRRNLMVIGLRSGGYQLMRIVVILSTVFWIVPHLFLPPLIRELMTVQDLAGMLFLIGVATRSPEGPGGTKRWRFTLAPQPAWSAG